MNDVYDQIEAFRELVRWTEGWNLDEDIERALDEDLGKRRHDLTSEAMVDKHQTGQADLICRRGGRLAGAVLITEILLHAPAVQMDTESYRQDGDALEPGDTIARLTGPLRDILKVERVMLNYLTHLSGVATLTARYVEAVAGTRARIYDTRKTLPGLRWLQKYAVTCGGGQTHRIGLYDAMLIKDNHLAHLRPPALAEAITEAADQVRKKHKDLKFVEVEVDTLEQLEQVLKAPIDLVLLDNMPGNQLRQAVAVRDTVAPGVELEASGGVSLDTVAAIAATGVDRISVGALTHSAPALDIGLDLV